MLVLHTFDSDHIAAAFHNYGVPPHAVEHRHPLAAAQDAEAARQVDSNAGGVFREYAALQCPDAGGFRLPRQFAQQQFADALPRAAAST